MNFHRLCLALALSLFCAQTGRATVITRGVLFVVADGLGPGGLDYALSRYAETGSPALPNLKEFIQNSRTSLVFTHSADSPITDSAASATALACGAKTKNGVLGLDASGRPLVCLGDLLKKNGQALGLVTTTDSWDATPAAFSAHVADRRNKTEIRRQQDELKPDVIIGSDRLGPFEKEKGATLTQMTRHALDVVSANEKGFFLLVETERTDETGHANDLPGFLSAMEELDQTIGALRQYQKEHPEKTLILTSDHDTGGLGALHASAAATWLTKGHTALPVPLFAMGPGAEQLPGTMDNTEVFALLTRTLGLPSSGSARGPVLVVAAHPDDETLFGGVLGYLKEADIDVFQVTITRGEGGHTNLIDGDLSDLGALRTREAQKAADLYGVRKLVIVGEPDAAFRDPKTDLPTRDVDFFLKSGAWNVSKIKARISELAEKVQPEAVITMLPKHKATHAHHQAAARIVMDLQKEGRLGARLKGVYGSYEIHSYASDDFPARAEEVRFPVTVKSEKLGMTYSAFQQRGAGGHASQTVSRDRQFKEDEILLPLYEPSPAGQLLRDLAAQGQAAEAAR